ncbi:MAG TPA: hypothetical protein VF783_14225 [Terriglobales bacterium]
MRKLLAGLAAAVFTASASATTFVPIQLLTAIAANTVLANATGSTASVTAFAMPSCSTSVSALNWTTSTGFTCNTSLITASTVSSTYAPLASPALTGTPTAPTATAGTSTTQISTTAFAQNAVTGGGNAGSFTTLNASGNDALLYSNTSAQSLTSGTAATITGWTKTYDRVNANFNASTGVFTAPATGYYQVSGMLTFASALQAVNTAYQMSVVVNGATTVAQASFRTQAAATFAPTVVLPTVVVSLTAGQTITVQGFQNSGSAQTLNNGAALNVLSINRLP